MVKYITSFLVFLTGSLSCLGMTDYDFTVDNIFYKFAKDGVYVTYGEYDIIPWGYQPSEIVPCPDQYEGDVIIPASVTYDGVDYPVTRIGERAFYNCSSLTSVQIPNSVTEIGNEAFYECNKLQSIRIPDSVDTMGQYVFRLCDTMEAFYGKFASEDNRLLVIDGEIRNFAGHGLESYCIPDNITAIGYFAFDSCGLVSIEIPNSVVAIKNSAFINCEKLVSVQIPESVVEIGYGTFWNCLSLEEIVLPENLTSIEGYCFKDCRKLQSVVLPKSLNKICSSAFNGCSSISKITSHVRVPMTVELSNDIFDSEIYAKCQLSVPYGSSDLYKDATVWKNFRDIVELPLSADYIPMLEQRKEWGYAQYRPCPSWNEYFMYYRLGCGSKVNIEGIEYTEIRQYSSFLMPDDAPVVAYMREDEGRIYARYPYGEGQDIYNYYFSEHSEDQAQSYTPEHLLYDFNLEVGDYVELDPSHRGGDSDEKLTLKCIETGMIEVDGISRKYIRLDSEVNSDTEHWMKYDYLIEGVGPVGNCHFATPYREETMPTMYSSFPTVRMLYQRETPSEGEQAQNLQGMMLYRSGYFDVLAVCDPSVYLWATAYNESGEPSEANHAPVNHSVTDLNLKLRYKNGKPHIVNRDGVLKVISVYNEIGRLLDTFHPDTSEFEIDPNKYEEEIVIKASTEKGSRSFTL